MNSRIPGKFTLLFILFCLFCSGCSEKKTSPKGRAETTPPDSSYQGDHLDNVIAAYWNSLGDIERATGKKSSHSYYAKFSFTDQNEEQILRCAQWVLANTWMDGSTTCSVLLRAMEDNKGNVELILRGVEADHPVLPPLSDIETPIPNWRKMYLIALLHLVDIKRRAVEKLMHPDYGSLDPDARAGLKVLQFGGHFMCDNGTLFHYLIGNAIRCAAADFLIWVIEKDISLTLQRRDIIDIILENENKRNSFFTGWHDDLMTLCDNLVKIYGHAFPENPPEDLVNHLRKALSQEMKVSSDALTLAQIRDIYSTGTLSRYFNEFIKLGEGFAGLTARERENEREGYQTQSSKVSPQRSPYLKNVEVPNVVIPLQLEDVVITKLRLIVTALSMQEAILLKRTTQPQPSVKIMGLDPSWAVDPFTDKPFTTLFIKPGRLTLNGQPPEWFYAMDQIYAMNMRMDIDFPTPREKAQE
ncbi:hypothetical protein JW926_12830 [Candidatus Sumerlaeota bacterium]|nr:hypothetical protein [Candidatus Sumerlaeota bacterium]